MIKDKKFKALQHWWLGGTALLSEWILSTGFWTDNKLWIDTENWID